MLKSACHLTQWSDPALCHWGRGAAPGQRQKFSLFNASPRQKYFAPLRTELQPKFSSRFSSLTIRISFESISQSIIRPDDGNPIMASGPRDPMSFGFMDELAIGPDDDIMIYGFPIPGATEDAQFLPPLPSDPGEGAPTCARMWRDIDDEDGDETFSTAETLRDSPALIDAGEELGLLSWIFTPPENLLLPPDLPPAPFDSRRVPLDVEFNLLHVFDFSYLDCPAPPIPPFPEPEGNFLIPGSIIWDLPPPPGIDFLPGEDFDVEYAAVFAALPFPILPEDLSNRIPVIVGVFPRSGMMEPVLESAPQYWLSRENALATARIFWNWGMEPPTLTTLVDDTKMWLTFCKSADDMVSRPYMTGSLTAPFSSSGRTPRPSARALLAGPRIPAHAARLPPNFRHLARGRPRLQHSDHCGVGRDHARDLVQVIRLDIAGARPCRGVHGVKGQFVGVR